MKKIVMCSAIVMLCFSSFVFAKDLSGQHIQKKEKQNSYVVAKDQVHKPMKKAHRSSCSG